MEYFSLSLFEITICPFGPTLEYEYAEELSVIPLRWYNLSIRLYNCERGTGYSCVREGHQWMPKEQKWALALAGSLNSSITGLQKESIQSFKEGFWSSSLTRNCPIHRTPG